MIREDTATASPGTILLRRGEILLPEVPEGSMRRVNGLITSALKGGAQKTDGRILLPNEKEVAALAVNADGKIVKQAQAPKGDRILLPNEDEVGKLSVVSEAKEDRSKNEKQALLFYISQPWSYLNNRLEQVGLVSPVGEMQGQIDDFRANAPKISPASKTLLRSPIKSIREMEKRRLLLDDDISEAEYQAAIAPDIALIDVSNLDFISEESGNDSLDGFYDFLSTSIDELFDISASGSERVRHLADVCQKLNLITQAFLYKSGNFKLNNAALLEKVTSKLEFLTTGEFKNSTRYLQPLFDFISYFEMNNSSASSYLLEILENNNYKHPLINELIYQLNPEERVDKDQPKIGIEIEAIPSVIFGDIPHGFEMGIDDGLTMPEIRRKKENIQFDLTHKKDLYDFWYFAKMTQLRGASVHIHIDDPDKEKIVFFKKLLGISRDTVKQSNFGTVELRFNLSSYENQDGDFVVNMATPFFHDQFDLTSFIEALMEYGDNQSISPETMSSLPDFWKLRLEKAKPISFDEVMSILEKSNWDSSAVEKTLERLKENLSFEETTQMLEKFKWSWEASIKILRKLDGTLSFEQITKIMEIFRWDVNVTEEIFKKLDRILSFEQVMEIVEKNQENWQIISLAFKKLEETLSSEQILNLSKKSDWNSKWNIIEEALKKMGETLSFEEVMEISEKHTSYSNIAIEALNKLDKPLSIERAILILEKLRWNENILDKIFEKLGKDLSFEEFIKITTKFGWKWQVTVRALSKLKNNISFDKAMEISEKHGWDYTVATQALKKLNEPITHKHIMEILEKPLLSWETMAEVFKNLKKDFSFKEFMEIAEKSEWAPQTIFLSLRRTNGTLSIEQIIKILEKTKQSAEIAAVSFEMLDKTLSFSQIIKILEKFNNGIYIASQALEKLRGTLSPEQVMKILRNSGQKWQVVIPALKKLEGTLSIEQIIEISKNSRWDGDAISPALEKIDGALSFDQAMEIIETARWSNSAITITLDKLTIPLSFEQVMKILKASRWKNNATTRALKKLDKALSFNQGMEILRKSRWKEETVIMTLEAMERSTNKNKSHYLELLKEVPKEQRLLVWSLLLKKGFKKPIKLKASYFEKNKQY